MQDQVSKMRMIWMFYLGVFVSALFLSGLMDGGQQELLPIAKQSTVMLFVSHPDSSAQIDVTDVSSRKADTESEAIKKSDKKRDLVPFEFDFSFSSLIQWFFRLPSKAFM